MRKFPALFEKYGAGDLRKIVGNKLLDKNLGETTWVFRNLKDYLEKKCKNNLNYLSIIGQKKLKNKCKLKYF